MIEARHLRVLRAVARGGSFSAAARALGCTQPAVSQQMKALELAAGTPLLVRGPREMRLTEAGEVLVRHADGILAGLTAAEEEVAAIAGLRAGRVRLVSFASGTATLVPGAVAEMRSAHPGTEVSLVEAQPPRSVEMLRAGDCDIALAFRYADLPTPAEESWDDLVVRPLLADRLVGVVPPGHRLAGAGGPGRTPQAVELAELAGERWIAGCPRCRRHLVELCERAGFTPRIDFATDDYPAVIGLVAAGVGVTVLPRLALESVRSRGVAVVALRPQVQREVVALTLPDLAQVPAVDVMLGRLARAGLRRA
ncbi:MAG: LysR family transcriptional regulator [Streptomyces sp.]|nr:LysR family transcriptional regulator [Streptomyces sp.]NUS14026.1 LysR family transcriptional regulator [Streptomyces sp.]